MDCLPLNLPAFAAGLLAQAATAAPAADAGISTKQYIALALIVAVIAIPIFLGNVIARALRMPDYGTRIGWILFAILASGTILSVGKLGRGVDLRGGTILVYEIDPTRSIAAAASDVDEVGSMTRRNDIASSELIPSLVKRINPAGTQEIVIRPYGENQIEIIIPAVDPLEVDRIKEVIEQAGILRFAILGNTRDHQRLIELARAQADQATQRQRLNKTVFDSDGTTPIGFWALVDREDQADSNEIRPLRVDVSRSILRNPADGRLLELPVNVFGAEGVAAWMKSVGQENIQVLMSVDSQLDVTGEDLAFAATGFDRDGSPSVRFKLTDSGSNRFYALTTNNAPDGQHLRYLGIILDDKLLSAPSIKSPISGDGQISGNFSTAEVEDLVRILKAGQLPAALTKKPIAENQIDATLGADTIRKGLYAAGASMIAVLVFMLVYYRFTGVIACIVLVLNLLMTLAVMILINQPLTLPGLAGLVLTVGMSVDANVLIFERIREELAKGAAARMAIRNGFARATTTIIDANLTTLITAIVLYAIGTDQIRGFAVTLILGILFSMFTAIYVSRTMLDIAERKSFLSLSMSNAVASLRDSVTAGKGFNFMGNRRIAVIISSVLMVAGLAAIIARGGSIFDIDFSGGSSITFRVENPTTTETVRTLIGSILTTDEKGSKIDYTVNNVSVDTAPKGTIYKVDTSIESVDDLKDLVGKGFADQTELKLVTYNVDVQPAKVRDASPAADEKKSSQIGPDDNGVRLVAMRPQNDASAVTAADTAEAAETAATEDVKAEVDAENPPAGDTPSSDATSLDATSLDATTTDATTPDSTTSDATKPDGPNVPASAAINASVPEVMSRSQLALSIKGATDEKALMNAKTLMSSLVKAAQAAGVALDPLGVELEPIGVGADLWSSDSDLRFGNWEIGLPIEFGPADEVMSQLKQTLDADPVWISSSSVGSRVAGDMVGRALGALFASLIAIIAYIWFRFNRVVYGIAAVAALVHDVLITIGAIAVSYWLADALGFLLVDQFKISLTVVASLLTVIGYSLNDTIVVFDRIRETKGKSLRLTSGMINDSINSTLSRTLLTSLTTLLVVVVLYFFGGDGIHAFAFSLVIGIMIGTYSSIFVASPLLLWLADRDQPAPR